MRLPRDIGGNELAALLSRYGTEVASHLKQEKSEIIKTLWR